MVAFTTESDTVMFDYASETSDDYDLPFLRAPTDLSSLARLIEDPNCRSIAILTGSGASEFSEQFSGMFESRMDQNLLTTTPQQKEMLQSDPTNLVSWETFQENPLPYLEVRRPFILGLKDGTSKPTITHRFMELLQTNTNKLTRIYTQNIDGLDEQCKEIPQDKIVHLRGTISQAECEGCCEEMDFEDFSGQIKTKIKDIYNVDDSAPDESTEINCPSCGRALMKTKTVLFGRTPPDEFFARCDEDLPELDLLIVAGTSLFVSPASDLFDAVPDSACRVIVNSSRPVGKHLRCVNSLGNPSRDYFAKGDCDEIFLDLIEELGWTNDLLEKKDLLPEKSQTLLASKVPS